MVGALDPVDEARKGHPEDIFVPIEEIEPAVIALGYDQHHDEEAIAEALAARGIDCELRRTSARDPAEGELLSTGDIIDRILAERA
jgi:FAD synthetase